MQNKRTYFTLGFIFGILPSLAHASPMVYTPVNPDFGGSPFNAAGLLAEANAQNQYTAKPTSNASTLGQSAGDLFQSSLVSQAEQAVYNAASAGQSSGSKVITAGDLTITYGPDPNNAGYDLVKLIGPASTTTVDIPITPPSQ